MAPKCESSGAGNLDKEKLLSAALSEKVQVPDLRKEKTLNAEVAKI